MRSFFISLLGSIVLLQTTSCKEKVATPVNNDTFCLTDTLQKKDTGSDCSIRHS